MAASRTHEILRILDLLEGIQPRTQSRLIALLALEDTFSELQIDPLGIHEHQRQPKDPRVVGAITATRAITRALTFTMDKPDLQSIRDSAVHCTRRWWFSLLRWLDFIHPKQQCIRFDGRIAEVLVSAYSALVTSKDALLDLMEETPEFFSLLFDLWLHYPDYTKTSGRFEPLAMHLFSSISSAVMVLTLYADADDNTIVRAHSTAVREAMLVTRMRPKHMYKRAVQYMQYCRNAGGTLVYGVCSIQLRTLTYLVKGALPIPRHSRKTIDLLVDLIRETNRGTDEDAAEATGADACALLHDVWTTDEGHRSLIRALQKGLLRLLMELNFQTSGRITHILSYVCKRSIFLPVARTLGEVCPQSSFRYAKMHSEVNGTEVDIQHRERLKVMHSLLPEKLCGNEECGYVLVDEQRRMKACRCFRVRYCSRDCQEAHWPVHRLTCQYKTRTRFTMRMGELRPIEIQYAASLALLYLERAGRTIVSEIDAHLARLADPSEKRIFVVKIDFLNEILPRHEIDAFSQEDLLNPVIHPHIPPSTKILRSLVQVAAVLGRVGGTMTAIVAKPNVTVETFRRRYGRQRNSRRPSIATDSRLDLFVRGSSSCTRFIAAAQLYMVQPVSVTAGSISTFTSMCTASKRPCTPKVSSRSEYSCDWASTDSYMSTVSFTTASSSSRKASSSRTCDVPTPHKMVKVKGSVYEEERVQKPRVAARGQLEVFHPRQSYPWQRPAQGCAIRSDLQAFQVSQQWQNMQDGIVRVRDIVRASLPRELQNELADIVRETRGRAQDLQQPLRSSQGRWILPYRRVFFRQTKPNAGEETLLYLRAHASKRESTLLERVVILGGAKVFYDEADELWRQSWPVTRIDALHLCLGLMITIVRKYK
ncbi:uncharacterized protein SCHCODRAFT_02557169 [Schizophyllum commune H4-8]|uniref:MYND-type domain-containing protein n=1 Tax=Schizophyllum commune (strain H4-8 / FGSC 9210) TaxID=578458 RepID=D8QJY7_SCHCM